jgi:hypothetical protein
MMGLLGHFLFFFQPALDSSRLNALCEMVLPGGLHSSKPKKK